MQLPHGKRALVTALCAATFSQLCLAEVAPPVILQIDYENRVRYVEDVSDPSKFGILPGPVAATSGLKNLTSQYEFADLVAVNGQPAKVRTAFTLGGSIQPLASSTLPGPLLGSVVSKSRVRMALKSGRS
jgi:hypothetical protein